MRRRSHALVALLVGVAALVVWIPESGAQVTADATVTLQGNTFIPATVELSGPNKSVRWTHKDGQRGHTITFDPPASAFESHPDCTTGETDPDCFQEGDNDVFVTFTTPGSFSYHCRIHEFMKGRVNVGGTPPTVTSTTTTTAPSGGGGATSTTRKPDTTDTTVGTLTTEATTTSTSSSSTTSTTVDDEETTTTIEDNLAINEEDDGDDEPSGVLQAVGVLLLAAVIGALIPAWRRLT